MRKRRKEIKRKRIRRKEENEKGKEFVGRKKGKGERRKKGKGKFPGFRAVEVR